MTEIYSANVKIIHSVHYCDSIFFFFLYILYQLSLFLLKKEIVSYGERSSVVSPIINYTAFVSRMG